MRDAQGSGELERLLAEHGGDLMRTAALLAGSRQDGEDLLQAALERLLRRGAGLITRRPICGAPCTTWPPTAGGARAPDQEARGDQGQRPGRGGGRDGRGRPAGRADRSFAFSGHRVLVMMDVFNLLNSNAVTNFALGNGATYNRIIATLQPRTFQFGVRLEF